MPIDAIDTSQRNAARVAGLTYLIAMGSAVAGFMIRAALMVPGDAAETARLVAEAPGLFRLSLLSDLVTCITDIVLIVAIYVVLRPVNRNLAQVAAFWRLMETAVLVVAMLNGFAILRVLSGADFLDAFEMDALAVQVIGPAYMAPMGVFEIGMGFWLLFRGLRPSLMAAR